MDPDLRGKVALVTGASRGIGKAIAAELGRCGAAVALASRDAAAIAGAAVGVSASGAETLAVPADVSREDQVEELFRRIEAWRGRLDILVNNAGVGSFGPLRDFPVDDLDRMLAVNVRGTFLCSRAALRLMGPRRSGYIVNIASVVGFKGYPDQAGYTASKHGVMGLTKSLAVEAQADGIRVSAILPGGVDTDLVGAARPDLDRSDLMQPEDIARAVLFLLSLPDRAAIDEIYIRRRTSRPF